MQTYDSFRNDDFKKHAPFDAIIYKKSTPITDIKEYIERINAEIAAGRFGKISAELRKAMIKDGIATVEIKSSALNQKDLQGVKARNDRTESDCQCITQNISARDFFVYPHFNRSSREIDNFYKYAERIRYSEACFSDVKNTNYQFLRKLIRIEFDHACDVYTRLFFDYDSNQVYIPGYINRIDFFRNPCIKKCLEVNRGTPCILCIASQSACEWTA